jgi:hypothetical protein
LSEATLFYEGGPILQVRKFEKALGGLIDTEIGLFLIDNQFIEGVLLDVKQDHLVIDVNQNIFYLALQHIQAITKNAKDYRVTPRIVPYLDRNYLVDVLKALRYNWVSINCVSNQVLFGVLSKVSEDHITIINNTEQLYIQNSFISNINSTISEDQVIKINNQEQLDIQNSYTSKQKTISHMDDESKEQSANLTEKEMQDCQVEEQVTLEYPQISNEINPIVNIKDSIVEKHAEEVIEIENVTNEYTDISQNKTIQDSVFDMNDESIEQSDYSLEVEMQECQVEEQVAGEHTQPTSEIDSIINVEASSMEKLAEEAIEIGNVTNEYTDISQNKTIQDSVFDMNDESKEQSDSSLEVEMQ